MIVSVFWPFFFRSRYFEPLKNLIDESSAQDVLDILKMNGPTFVTNDFENVSNILFSKLSKIHLEITTAFDTKF